MAPSLVLFGTALLLSQSSISRLSITMLDIGQGDSLVIEGRGDRGLVVDTGPGARSARVIEQFLSRRGHQKVDLAVTHADRDHAGGTAHLMDHIAVDNAFSAWKDASWKDPAWKDDVFHQVRAGDRLPSPTSVRLMVLHPWKPGKGNESSLVVLAALPGIRILLTGDAGEASEASIVQAWRSLLADRHPDDVHILKVGHHGSRTSTGEQLVSVFRPDLSLISAGSGNSFGHPHVEVLERLAEAGSTVISTLGSGAIRVQIRRKGITLHRWTGQYWSRIEGPDTAS